MHINLFVCTFAVQILNKNTMTKAKNTRLEAIRLIISSNEISGQDELLKALSKEGFGVTQATLSRDLKQLKVAKAASMNGRYVYVLPNETMYKRISSPSSTAEMMKSPGFKSITFSGDIGVIRTRPGYASSIAYNLDNSNIPDILGTIAGDDTIIIITKQGSDKEIITEDLKNIVLL